VGAGVRLGWIGQLSPRGGWGRPGRPRSTAASTSTGACSPTRAASTSRPTTAWAWPTSPARTGRWRWTTR
jgi:hypothetical protein